jgi:hypothetical protein
VIIPVGKPHAEAIRKKKGNAEVIRTWVDDARNAFEFGLTPEEYASEILERNSEI